MYSFSCFNFVHRELTYYFKISLMLIKFVSRASVRLPGGTNRRHRRTIRTVVMTPVSTSTRVVVNDDMDPETRVLYHESLVLAGAGRFVKGVGEANTDVERSSTVIWDGCLRLGWNTSIGVGLSDDVAKDSAAGSGSFDDRS